jgi:hypothetical protein
MERRPLRLPQPRSRQAQGPPLHVRKEGSGENGDAFLCTLSTQFSAAKNSLNNPAFQAILAQKAPQFCEKPGNFPPDQPESAAFPVEMCSHSVHRESFLPGHICYTGGYERFV